MRYKSSNISCHSVTDSPQHRTSTLLTHFFSSNLEPVPKVGGSSQSAFHLQGCNHEKPRNDRARY